MKKQQKPVVYWVLQDNQTTPTLIDFFAMTQEKVKEFLSLKFLIPAPSTQTLKLAKKLGPTVFQVGSQSKSNSFDGYCRKKGQLGDNGFSDGLKFWQALLLDDLGSGNLYQALIKGPDETNVAGIIIQIPTPLGSSESEERIFYAWTHLAKKNKVPIIGYELLPLSARWTLAPSLVDAIITTRKESYTYLTGPVAEMSAPVWRLPRYEGRLFSPTPHHLWRTSMGSRYHMKNVPFDKTILYIPHNVAMTYEYRNLLIQFLPFSPKLHLMFAYGKDQVRGGHTHQEIIETVCRKELPQFSYTFHDLATPGDIIMADALIACSDCYAAEISSVIGLPTIIYDPMISPVKEGYKNIINRQADLKQLINDIIAGHMEEQNFSTLLIDLAKRQITARRPAVQGASNG